MMNDLSSILSRLLADWGGPLLSLFPTVLTSAACVSVFSIFLNWRFNREIEAHKSSLRVQAEMQIESHKTRLRFAYDREIEQHKALLKLDIDRLVERCKTELRILSESELEAAKGRVRISTDAAQSLLEKRMYLAQDLSQCSYRTRNLSRELVLALPEIDREHLDALSATHKDLEGVLFAARIHFDGSPIFSRAHTLKNAVSALLREIGILCAAPSIRHDPNFARTGNASRVHGSLRTIEDSYTSLNEKLSNLIRQHSVDYQAGVVQSPLLEQVGNHERTTA